MSAATTDDPPHGASDSAATECKELQEGHGDTGKRRKLARGENSDVASREPAGPQAPERDTSRSATQQQLPLRQTSKPHGSVQEAEQEEAKSR